MENELSANRISRELNIKLPKIHLRIGARSPLPYRFTVKPSHKRLKSDGNVKHVDFTEKKFIHLEKDPQDEEFSFQRKTHKIRQQTPVLTYENVVMSKDLAIMAQVRKGVISEITSNRVQNLTPDLLNSMKHQYLPNDLKNTGNSQQVLQKQKAIRERITRHPFATAAYAIRSLSPQSRRAIKLQLKLSLPRGSRFLEQT